MKTKVIIAVVAMGIGSAAFAGTMAEWIFVLKIQGDGHNDYAKMDGVDYRGGIFAGD